MDFSIVEQFGQSATISGGILSVTLSELELDSATPTSSQIIGAFLLKRRSLMNDASLSDPSVGLTVDEPFTGLTTRQDRQQAQVQYSVSLYKDIDSNTTSISDPDQISI